MEEHLFYYRADVTSVYDADTCTMNIDLGLGAWLHGEKIRLARINAPELRGDERPQGLIARDFLREKIDGKSVFINTIKDKKGKYGRYIAEIWVTDENDNYININDELVTAGHAIYVEY